LPEAPSVEAELVASILRCTVLAEIDVRTRIAAEHAG
jgi:hypothetical protein